MTWMLLAGLGMFAAWVPRMAAAGGGGDLLNYF